MMGFYSGGEVCQVSVSEMFVPRSEMNGEIRHRDRYRLTRTKLS